MFLIFPGKQDLTLHANCQILFSRKNKEHIRKFRPLKILPRVLSIHLLLNVIGRLLFVNSLPILQAEKVSAFAHCRQNLTDVIIHLNPFMPGGVFYLSLCFNANSVVRRRRFLRHSVTSDLGLPYLPMSIL